jgi:hypothetical protein
MEYRNGRINGLEIADFWPKLAGPSQDLIFNEKYARLVAKQDLELMNGYISNLAVEVNNFKKNKATGINTADSEKIIVKTFGEFLIFIDNSLMG